MQGDLIEVYKIMRRIDRMNAYSLFLRDGELKTRGHRFKVKGDRFNRDLRGNFFTQSAVYMEWAATEITGEVLEDWRVENVVPLFKKGSEDKPGNYRPVSLASVVGKLLERTLRDRSNQHSDNE
eukprot:g27877.t1